MLPDIENLQSRFADLCARNAINNSDELWALVHKHYTEPHRAYHNLTHLAGMFEDLGKYSAHHKLVDNGFDIEYRDELEAAIWFHDIIMVTKDEKGNTPNNNEQRSADLAEEKLFGSLLNVNKVSHLIMLTRHSLTQNPKTLEEELILDLDLAILGKPRPVFDKYEAGIQVEYAHVPVDFRCKVRGSVLSKFAEMEPLYKNEFFRDLYEASAKRNLHYSIENLRKGKLPSLESTDKGR